MKKSPFVAILVQREQDLQVMQHAAAILQDFGVAVEAARVNKTGAAKLAHQLQDRGAQVVIAGESSASFAVRISAGVTIPVLAVPLQSKQRPGAASLLELLGYDVAPVGSLAIGVAGAKNAAYSAISILALSRPALARKLKTFRKKQTAAVLAARLEPEG